METIYWIWLSLRCGAGSELGSYLLRNLETPRAIYEADRETLMKLDGITEEICEVLMDRDLDYANRIMEYCERTNVGIMTSASRIYPDRLRSIHAKPLLLYYRGRVPDFDSNVVIACVGTRKCSPQGRVTAEKLGAELARAGAIVVSGMALGIDSAAQRGALAVGGHTVAVLGCGIDRVYPLENEELMRRIAAEGTVLTEFAPGTEPNGKNFPIRNRIISGLCQGTVVVEADMFSGSLITARAALQQGRDIFAFPGNPEEYRSDGTNALIQDGANLVTCAADVLREYEAFYPSKIDMRKIPSGHRYGRHYVPPADPTLPPSDAPSIPAPFGGKKPKKKQAPPVEKKGKTPSKGKEPPSAPTAAPDASALSEQDKLILSLLTEDMTPDAIAAALRQKTGEAQDVGALLGTLTMLEVDGFITAMPGGIFRRN